MGVGVRPIEDTLGNLLKKLFSTVNTWNSKQDILVKLHLSNISYLLVYKNKVTQKWNIYFTRYCAFKMHLLNNLYGSKWLWEHFWSLVTFFKKLCQPQNHFSSRQIWGLNQPFFYQEHRRPRKKSYLSTNMLLANFLPMEKKLEKSS